MAKENNLPENTEQNAPQISIVAQYVKDVSFESPDAPNSLRQTADKPNIGISVDVLANPLTKDTFEVELRISATAKKKEDVVFICEVKYGGVFILQNVAQQEMQPALLVFCPTLLFPFARRIVSDLTRDGGFPALLLDPIDFSRLYQQRMSQAMEE